MNMFQEKTFQYRGLSYSYLTTKKKTRSPIIILTGFSGTHVDFVYLGRELAKERQVILVDYPGWGRAKTLSDQSHTISAYAEFVTSLLEKLCLTHVVLIGHCFGATVAIKINELRPKMIEQTFLINPPYEENSLIYKGLKFCGECSKRVSKKLKPFFFLWRIRPVTFVFTFFAFNFKSLQKRLRYAIRNVRRKEIESVAQENAVSFYDFNWKTIGMIKTPLHIMYSGQDIIVSEKDIETLKKITPQGATYDLFKTNGHLLPLESPNKLARQIMKYL